jgi:hypothetical protein
MLLLKIFYIVLLVALIFFGPLQAYLHEKKSEWDLKRSPRELNANATPIPADPEKMGGRLTLVLTILASAFFILKILAAAFALYKAL